MTVVAAGRAGGAYAAGLNPLRGRDDELASLHRHLTRLRNGAGTSWLLEGAAGLGKSRLVEHAAAAALIDTEQDAEHRSQLGAPGNCGC